jgi:hypothetical protein
VHRMHQQHPGAEPLPHLPGIGAHASTPARSGPRFGRELAARPIEPDLAAILTRARLRVVTSRPHRRVQRCR